MFLNEEACSDVMNEFKYIELLEGVYPLWIFGILTFIQVTKHSNELCFGKQQKVLSIYLSRMSLRRLLI